MWSRPYPATAKLRWSRRASSRSGCSLNRQNNGSTLKRRTRNFRPFQRVARCGARSPSSTVRRVRFVEIEVLLRFACDTWMAARFACFRTIFSACCCRDFPKSPCRIPNWTSASSCWELLARCTRTRRSSPAYLTSQSKPSAHTTRQVANKSVDQRSFCG